MSRAAFVGAVELAEQQTNGERCSFGRFDVRSQSCRTARSVRFWAATPATAFVNHGNLRARVGPELLPSTARHLPCLSGNSVTHDYTAVLGA